MIKHGFLLAGSLALICISNPSFAQSGSTWNSDFGQGILEYSTGVWDDDNGGAILLSCKGSEVSVATQINGKGAPDGSFILRTSSRKGGNAHRFAADARGFADFKTSDARFGRLWSDLRNHDIVTIEYGNGQKSVQSLAGSSRTLPRKPCG